MSAQETGRRPELYLPQVFVTIYGIEHSGYNMQTALTLKHDLLASQGRSNGARIIFQESASSTQSSAKQRVTRINREGTLKDAMREICIDNRQADRAQDPVKKMLGLQEDCNNISDEAVEALSGRLHRESLEALIRDYSIPYDRLLTYFLDSSVQLCQQEGSTVLCEWHTPPTLKRFRELGAKEEAYDYEFRKMWPRGEFDKAIEAERQKRIVDRQSAIERDKETSDVLRDLVKSMLKNPQGGTLDVVFGAAHTQRLFQGIQQAFRNNSRVIVEHKTLATIDPYLKSARDNDMSDLTIAQGLLYALVRTELIEYFQNNNAVSLYGRNFDTVQPQIIDIVLSASLNDIRSICVEQQNPLDWLMQRMN